MKKNTDDSATGQAVIYTRFSPRRDESMCESCETQAAYCEQHAHQMGLEIVARFDDKAVSGKDGERPLLWAAIERLERGDVLLVYKPDRLARNLYLMEQLRRAVTAVGARIMCVQGDVEGDGPEAVMIRQVIASINEYERKIIGLRTKFAMLHHQKNGRLMSRHPPYGWRVDPDGDEGGRMIEVPEEQRAISRIRALRKNGVTSSSTIAQVLNAEMPEVARAGKWSAKTVGKIIGRE